MSESIVRKIQPFTIGTKLSVPSVPKCSDFGEPFLPGQALDNCRLGRGLNKRVPPCPTVRPQGGHAGPRPSAVAVRVAQAEHRREETEGDALDRNAVSPTGTSRSIRKIAISGSTGAPLGGSPPGAPGSSVTHNINNNNSNVAAKLLPRIVGLSCENRPNSHLKVLLRKDVNSAQRSPADPTTSGLHCAGDKSFPILQAPVLSAPSPKRVLLRRENPSCGHTESLSCAKFPPQEDCSFTQRNTLFNREVQQAEAWIKGQLRDLKDGCNIQRSPLQDWEELSLTLQRDLKDFENNLIQLNQMGEQLVCKSNPSSELVKKQLSQLRDQWNILKQTAATQSKALGGAKNLQEFNKKVDKLEAWIKEKEEQQLLEKVLRENVDKMQLTRRILDLKQDEQQYRALHEEINHLAMKLEKQGRAEGKNISTRRKHVNKIWLKVQTLLRDQHDNLQLALEVSTFRQQADGILRSIDEKRKNIFVTSDQESSGDREIRDIASQIMMLDVTVSQLSNLHPALAAMVTQKQGEVKDAWAVLQQAVRSEKSALPSPGSDFTREDGDPATPSRELPGSVGIEAQRILGKEVKEEQNRLKGCVTSGDPRSNKTWESSGDDEDFSPSPVSGKRRIYTDDVSSGRQTESERGQMIESKPAGSRGQPQLQAQLQKFTVSADKTLAWLKDNVAMATQICCTASLDGFEAAKKCQRALEEEILSNRARIEVVKKEGRSLVRARHPGSTKIEEFLGQLEVLWEELKRRHQKNVVVLQESEKLNLKALDILKDLNTIETWLQTVELSIRQSSLAGDPESMSVAEQESILLGKEMSARGLQLRILQQEVDKLSSRRHFHIERLLTRTQEVEEKYRSVQAALTQQNSELQDTRMLTEFLERVELEESQELRRSLSGGLEQPLHCELGPEPPVPGLVSNEDTVPLSIGDPVEELREAVEMLNDTARERGRSRSQDQGIQELLSRHSSLSACISQGLSRSAELSVDILEAETDMAVKCEPHRCGLEGLQEQHHELENDCKAITKEVEEMEKAAARLDVLCPERVLSLGAEIQATLQAWEELIKSMAENQGRLRQFARLQDFFRNYLALISWTEDTRACIFSESTMHQGRGTQEPMTTEELDAKIEQKFEEFDDLAMAGQKLIDEEHHLTVMIRERTEELRSMLGWILVRWRVQKHQRNRGKRKPEPKADAAPTEILVSTPQQQDIQSQCPADMDAKDGQRTPEGLPAAPPSGCNEGWGQQQQASESGYEVMGSLRPRGSDLSSLGGELQGLLAVETPQSPFLVLKEPSAPSLGSTVNLILSFGKTGDGQLQTQESVEEPEAVHRPAESSSSACKNFWKRCQGLLGNTFGSLKRKTKIYRQSADEVSTYLHVKDNKAVSPVYESIILPRPASKPEVSVASSSSSSSSSSSCSSSSTAPPKASGVAFHGLPMGGTSSIFSSLKRRSKKRKRKRDVRRHTIQRIMGAEQPEVLAVAAPPVRDQAGHDTNTWPLKDRRKNGGRGVTPGREEPQDYVRNPLARDIDEECSGNSSCAPPTLADATGSTPAERSRNHCRYLSLGSVLSFELPKDLNLIPSIPDVITIAPPHSHGAGNLRDDARLQHPGRPYSRTDRHTNMSTFKQTGQPPTCGGETFEGKKTFRADQHLSQNFPSPEMEDSPNQRQIMPNNDLSDPNQDQDHDLLHLPIELRAKPDKGCRKLAAGLCPIAASGNHMCPSVHTKVRELNGYEYHRRDSAVSLSLASHTSAGHETVIVERASTAHSSSGSTRLWVGGQPPVPSYLLSPRGNLGRAVSRERAGHNEDPEDAIHPDHQQFEEEEEELEDIWNQTNGYRQSVCSDIMYQTYQGALASSPPGDPREPSPESQAVLYRKLVTASAPNLLVAEFRLPASVKTLLGYDGSPSGEDRNPARRERKSWASFPQRDQPSDHVALVNETASLPVKLPDTADQQQYIYQYREAEEEEEEEEVEEEVKEDTGCPKDQSMSLLSVHLGLEGSGQHPMSLNSPDVERKEHECTETTRGHCCTTNRKWPEFQSMEGTLERKHKLQLGGKKASCRAWSTYHAVLFRQTLCFYQDRKDTLKSSVSGLPLNLTGAECVPVPEYSKRANCFSLRLRDGSEYLLSAPSRFLMKKWMLKIQANSGTSEVDSTMPQPKLTDFSLNVRNHMGKATANEIVVLTRDSSQIPEWHQKNLEDLSPVSSSDAGHTEDGYSSLREDMRQRLNQKSQESRLQPSLPSLSTNQECPTSKRRAHSFTSATYQKITPMSPPPGGREGGSSYSVTLFIGDQLHEATPVSDNPDSHRQIGWQQEPFLQTLPDRTYASLPRPRNKSVFKKFFGKKE